MESQTKLSRREKTGMIVRYLRGCWGFFAGAVVLAWMNTACNALVPQIISFTVDSVLGGGPPDLPGFLRPLIPVDQLRAEPLSFLWLAAGAVVLAAAVRGVCIYGMRINLAKGSEGFVKGLRDGLYSHIQRLSFAWHTAHATGDIIQRCTSDVEVIRTFVCNQLMEVVRTVFLIVLYSSIMVAMNWRLAMVSLAFIPISLLASWVFYGKISTRFKAADEAEGELTTCTQENLTGVRVVRAFGREKFEIDRFGEKNDHFSALWVELGRLLSVYWASGAFLTAAQVMAVLDTGKDVAMLNLGDPSLYATYSPIQERVLAAGRYEVITIPGVPSFCAVAARLNRSLTKPHLPVHIIPGGYPGVEEALAAPGTKVLMKAGKEAARVHALLKGRPYTAQMVTACGLPAEAVWEDLSQVEGAKSYFSTILIREEG